MTNTPNSSPGRLYASVALKLVLIHFLQNYDCSLVDEKADRTFVLRSYTIPRECTLVAFAPRAL